MRKKLFILVSVYLLIATYVFAKDNLAVLPFTGASAEDGETLAELFMFDQTMNNVFTIIPRTSITRAMREEQLFQVGSGLTDPDSVVLLGKQIGAKYIIAGSITKLGDNKLLVVSIINTETLEQIAGDFLIFSKIEEIPAKIPAISQQIEVATKRDTSALPKIAATKVVVSEKDDSADILTQLLSIYLIRQGRYAVYPRTKSLEQVQTEWETQLNGDTADDNIVRIGAGNNPERALSCVARRLGEKTMFNASIINLQTGAQDIGATANYTTINDGIEVMQTLARDLSYGNETEWHVDSAERFMKAVESINNKKTGSYTIVLTDNVPLASSSIKFTEDGSKTVTITGDDHRRVITSSNIKVEKGISLTLGNNITIDGTNGGTLVSVSEGNLTLEEGVILQNGTRGVYVYQGRLKMNGGTICGNVGEGGVEIAVNATFIMSGGTISGNSNLKYGGGGVNIYNSGCTFVMSNGLISGNTSARGGGVYNGGGIFKMTGGTISGNTATEEGGGVRNTSDFRMTGGSIVGNTSKKTGGGVHSEGGFSPSFIKTGGLIDATNSADNGKVIYSIPGGERNTTAGPYDSIDSGTKGKSGGWE